MVPDSRSENFRGGGCLKGEKTGNLLLSGNLDPRGQFGAEVSIEFSITHGDRRSAGEAAPRGVVLRVETTALFAKDFNFFGPQQIDSLGWCRERHRFYPRQIVVCFKLVT